MNLYTDEEKLQQAAEEYIMKFWYEQDRWVQRKMIMAYKAGHQRALSEPQSSDAVAKKRYFIYKTSVPIANGSINTQAVVSCIGFINRDMLDKQVCDDIKAQHPEVVITADPIIDFLYEMTESEHQIYSQSQNSK